MREPVDWPTRDLLTHRVRSTPERTALVTADGDTTTYREYDAAADRVAATVERYADSEHSRVAALVDTRVEVGELLFGAMRCGATLAPLNVELERETLANQLETVEPDVLVCESTTESLAAAVADCPVVSLDEPASADVTSLAAETADTSTVTPVERSRDDTQLILFTSGTTSEPKGVRLTVGNLVASAVASAFRLGVVPGDRWLVCLPTYHMGGLAPFVRSALYGTTVVVQRSFDAERTQTVFDERDVTAVSLVPTMLKRLLDAGWEPSSALRFALLGGGPASEDLLERARGRGVPAAPTYGMTETASQIATALPETAADYPDTVGQPLVHTDVTVLGAGTDGDEPVPCDPGERGEIVVDGPTVTPGYLDDDATAAAFGTHGFHTGDLGYRDEDGRLWVVGRVDDRIVTGGENVVASEVAAVIRELSSVEACAVVGLSDPTWGERVAAAVVGDVTESDVLDHCRGRLASYEVPKTVRIVGELPRTASGTVDRDALRARLSS